MSKIKSIMRVTGVTLAATNFMTAALQFDATAHSRSGMNRPGKEADHYIITPERTPIPFIVLGTIALYPGAYIGQALGARVNKLAP